MLPPVQTASSLTVQNRAPNRQEYGGQARHGQEQMPGGTGNRPLPGGLSALPATNVNFLALSTTASPDMDLSRLAQIIGKALGLADGHKGEAAALMKQVAAALAALPPAGRMALERQFTPLLQGLPLQVVARALENPAGPEGARVIAFLELSRRGKDAATQSVVASYQQNEVSETDGFSTPSRPMTGGETEPRARPALPHAASPLETQLAQAAQAAALKAGIPLPLVPYALEDVRPDEDETPAREKSANGQAQDGDAGEDGEQDAHEEGLPLAEGMGEEAGEEAAEGVTDEGRIADETDDRVYSLYTRMAGDV